MVRLTRAQQQERTRATVVAAARQEFAVHGYAEAKIDRIAERAELTRGAVYSNFPSKRALYLAVLIDMVEHTPAGEGPPPSAPSPIARSPSAIDTRSRQSGDPAEALGTFARVWLERLPFAADTPASGHLQLRSLAGVLDDEPARTALAQVTRLEALLLALALESRVPVSARRVRLAELVLTLLHGSGNLAETAPGFGDPFDVARACEHLAGIDLADTWEPAHLPYVAPAQPSQDPWVPPGELPDEITGRPARHAADGVVAVLGSRRLEAAEEAVRAARPTDRITVAVATGDLAETGRLVRLRISDLTRCLRRVFPPEALPRLCLVVDDRALLATASGFPDADDATEAAVRIHRGRIVARAQGGGAVHAAATADASDPARSRGAGGAGT